MKTEKATYDSTRDHVPDVNPLEQVSRDRWAEAAGSVMARTFPPALLAEIVVQGYDEFERHYRPIAKQHGFRQANIKRIFEIIAAAARLNPVGGKVHIEMQQR